MACQPHEAVNPTFYCHERIQVAATHAQHDLARCHFRLGAISVDRLIQANVLVDVYGFHRKNFSSPDMGLRRAEISVVSYGQQSAGPKNNRVLPSPEWSVKALD
jgi:hypothetical protein